MAARADGLSPRLFIKEKGADAMEEILRMEHITKRFGEMYANRDINLTILKGEVHTLLGKTVPASPR